MCLEPDSLSSALAFPLDLGARPLCRRLRGRGLAPSQVDVTPSPGQALLPREHPAAAAKSRLAP